MKERNRTIDSAKGIGIILFIASAELYLRRTKNAYICYRGYRFYRLISC